MGAKIRLIWGRGGHRAPSLIYVVEEAPLNKRRKEFELSSWWPLERPLLSPPPTWARLPPSWFTHSPWWWSSKSGSATAIHRHCGAWHGGNRIGPKMASQRAQKASKNPECGENFASCTCRGPMVVSQWGADGNLNFIMEWEEYCANLGSGGNNCKQVNKATKSILFILMMPILIFNFIK